MVIDGGRIGQCVFMHVLFSIHELRGSSWYLAIMRQLEVD